MKSRVNFSWPLSAQASGLVDQALVLARSCIFVNDTLPLLSGCIEGLRPMTMTVVCPPYFGGFFLSASVLLLILRVF